MLFSSMVFIFIFLPFICCGYFILKLIAPKKIQLRNVFLLVASLFFYSWGEPKNIILMLISIVANYFFAQFRNKIIFILAIIFNLSFLFFFKYTGFFIQNINTLFDLNISIRQFALPIGISFYTFQALSYVIDVYRKKTEPQKNILNLALYISFFPQLIAGPIVRYTDIQNEIQNRTETFDGFISGLKTFMIGLGAKVILANNLAIFVDNIYANIENVPVLILYFVAIAYSLQIYFDFSGYSLMAIGLGKIFGFNFPENFRHPYCASSVTNFWQRWHITLSTWFRDYVYIPLGGNRVKPVRHILNIFITWMLTGLWHGASWNFVIWGLYYAVFLIFEKYVVANIVKRLTSKTALTIAKVFIRIASLFVIMFGWVIFRLEDASQLRSVLSRMLFISNASTKVSFFELEFLLNHASTCSKVMFIIPAIICSVPIYKKLFKNADKSNIVFSMELLFALAIFITSVSFLIASTYNPFIYFRF
ncbi:MAG: MBOAT family protein [Treponemataceae bacterium]